MHTRVCMHGGPSGGARGAQVCFACVCALVCLCCFLPLPPSPLLSFSWGVPPPLPPGRDGARARKRRGERGRRPRECVRAREPRQARGAKGMLLIRSLPARAGGHRGRDRGPPEAPTSSSPARFPKSSPPITTHA
ncbi:hypothetical protein H696_05664, partial [Fonticula alba]